LNLSGRRSNALEEDMKTRNGKTLAVTLLAAALACGGAVFAARPALAADLCVRPPQSGCFPTIQAAVDAAHDGDTIRVGPGTFAGGVTIDKSVNVVGVSAAATRIEGGGPVVTIGTWLAPDPPTVSISGVTITGGFNDSKPEVPAGPGFFAAGGGVLIQWPRAARRGRR
jgi:nitrous oxidase accessory protein NosD